MISSLLIANRGEIARRIIRTCRRLGIRSIAVFSDVDAHAPFVAEADQAIAIGPAPARESYLVGDRILEAARISGAEAVHPGYGFLSENAAFADLVIAAGLIWVGPPPSAIRAMGLKDAAKSLMASAGVPTTPGYLGDDQSELRLASEADRIGYPVLIKAVAGGGGKGMRRVDRPGEFAALLASCRREASAAFGDDRVLIETYVARPRHIEVQIFADNHGNTVHLFERDCSLQRRHQKVIEEAPAPGMDPNVRAAVCAAAVKAAQAVNYRGAGTVEFIADASEGLRADRIWFMEMNTRLQVEHPVTEAITGRDLVEWQLRVASGERLPLTQEQLRVDGWAMEARLYAENPSAGFLPSIGRLDHLRLPTETVRVDSAVEEGSEVTSFYDPMIAKLIVHAATRAEAAAALAAACRQVQVWPVKTNASFLARALSHADFAAGRIDTGFIDARLQELMPPTQPSAAVLQTAASRRLAGFAGDTTGFRLNAEPRIDVWLWHDGETRRITLPPGRHPELLPVFEQDGEIVVFEDGEPYLFRDPALATAPEAQMEAGSGAVISPMPGRVVALSVAVGDSVAKGVALVVVEAMKMELSLYAPFAGSVAEVAVQVGQQVTEGRMLIRMEPEVVGHGR
jgi:acetyl/propionyl-CoA carboxylase alpha subunit